MDNEKKTNLRQALNEIEIAGVLSEKNIEFTTKDGRNIVRGNITVKIDDINQIRLNVWASEKTKDGDPNKQYENIAKFNENAVSIADGGAENASLVQSNTVQLNPFVTQNGNNALGYKASFISVYRGDAEKFEPKAQGKIELYIQSITPETDKEGNETSRTIVKGWFPTYDGVRPLTLIGTEEDGVAQGLLEGYEAGQTVEFLYDIKNSRVEKTKEIPVKLGKPRIEKTVEYTNELIITGSSEIYEEGITQELPYDQGAMRVAIQEYKDKIQADANESRARAATQSKPSAAQHNRTANW